MALEAALERGKVDAERLEEIWKLEEDADRPREQELLVEEEAVMADFDQSLPPSADSPSIAVTGPGSANHKDDGALEIPHQPALPRNLSNDAKRR